MGGAWVRVLTPSASCARGVARFLSVNPLRDLVPGVDIVLSQPRLREGRGACPRSYG